MDFVTYIRPHMTISYFLGLSLFPLHYFLCDHEKKLPQWHRIVVVLPTLIWFAFKCCLCVATFTILNICVQMVTYTDTIMTNIFLACEGLKTISVVAQNFLYTETAAAILRNFQTIEFLFENMLNRPISYKTLRRDFLNKVYFAFGTYVSLLGFFVMHYTSLDFVDVPLVLIKIMHFISISMHINVVFYIDLITYNLAHLNDVIVKDTIDNSDDNLNLFVVKKLRTDAMIRQRLTKYKVIHFHLWRITEQTNEFFGWMLIAILLQSFSDSVYTAIWQLKVLYEAWNFIRIIRKYIV